MRVDLLSTNFSAGELSPRLYGRPDLAKYADAVKQARNVVILQHGGARNRPGLRYCGEVKSSADATRLVPYVVSRTLAFWVELGHLTARFRTTAGALVETTPGTPYEITTPYTSAQVFDVDYTQGSDTMLMAHPAHPIKRLRRFTDTRWVLDDAPFDPAPFDEIGMRQPIGITLGATSGSTTATAASGLWLASDVGRVLAHNGGAGTITSLSSSTVANITITTAFAATTLPASLWVLQGSPQTTCTPTDKDPVGRVTTLNAGADAWRATDVGAFVSLNGGLLQITGFTSATVASARIVNELRGTVAAEADSWTIERAVWNPQDGYPSSVTFHEQRTVAGGTAAKPQGIWGSRSGLYFDFTKGTADDDAYAYELGTDELNPIMFLSSNRALMALTYGGEWTISGGVEKPITPTNVRAQLQSKAGSDMVRPEQVDDDLYYAQRGAGRLRTLGYRLELGGYLSEEASTLSEHIVRGGIRHITYEQAPERVLWVLLTNGTFSAVTVSREQTIRAFSQCNTDGTVESMATLPAGASDVTACVVRRTIGGVTKRYVEILDWSTYVDSAVTRVPVGAVVSGLSHLAGKTVRAVADGIDLGTFDVTAGGQITLPRAAASVVVGLGYVPTLKLLAPDFGTGMGSAIGDKQMQGRTRVLFSDTVGCSVNGQPLAFRQFGEDVLDAPVPPFSGWKDVSDIGWAPDAAEIELTQPQAYPWCVLAVVRRVTANAG